MKYLAISILLVGLIGCKSLSLTKNTVPKDWVKDPFTECAPSEQIKAMLIGTWKPDHAVKTDPKERDLSKQEIASIQEFALVIISKESFSDKIWYTPCHMATSTEGSGSFPVFPNGFAIMGFPDESSIVYWVDSLDPEFKGTTRLDNFLGYLAGPNDLAIIRWVFKTTNEQIEDSKNGRVNIDLSGYYLYYKRVLP